MKITLLVTLLFGLVFLSTVGAAERPLTPQQQRMTLFRPIHPHPHPSHLSDAMLAHLIRPTSHEP